MSKRHTRPTSRHHVLIEDDDWALLSQMYGAGSTQEVGIGAVVRAIVHQACNKIRARQEQAIDGLRQEVREQT